MDGIKEENFPEPRSRQEAYLQDIIRRFTVNSNIDKIYPEPRSRQEAYLQLIISKMDSIGSNGGGGEGCQCEYAGKLRIVDEVAGKTYIGEIKIINGKPVLEYEEIKR